MGTTNQVALTPAQEGIWIGQALAPDSAAYVTAESIELIGPIDGALLAACTRQALHEAEGLRARLWVVSHVAYQELDLTLTLEPRLLTLPNVAAAWAWMEADARVGFDLQRGPFARHALLRVGDEHRFWYLAAHHLALDGFAFSLLIKRAAELYSAASEARPAPTCPFARLLPTVEEQLSYAASPACAQDRAFWREQLERAADPRALSGRLPRSVSAPRRCVSELDARTSASLEPSAKQRGPSWLHAISALFAGFVAERTGEAEVVLGLPVMARSTSLALRCPTMLMNIVPLRLRVDGVSPLRASAEAARQLLTSLLPHSRYRYEQLRRDLGRLGGERRLFGPVLNIMPFKQSPRFGDVIGSVRTVAAGPVEELSLNVQPLAQRSGLKLTFEAHPESYTEDALARLTQDFVLFVAQRAADPDRTLMAPGTQPREIVLEGEALQVPARDVLACILEHGHTSGARIAIQEPERETSYGELAQYARDLAARLARHGVTRGSRVALHLSRSREAVVAMLAVLICDAAYVPLDPDGPEQRSAAILRTAEPKLILTQAELPAALAALGIPSILLAQRERGREPNLETHDAAHEQEPDLPLDASVPAYVIFTSGSTGEPNGVVIGRAALSHFVAAARQRYALTRADRVLQFAPLAFDASVEEIFVTLASGARLVLRTSEMLASCTHFLQRCAELQITLLDLPTAFFHELAHAASEAALELPASLHTVIIGGEAALAERVQRFHRLSRGRVRLLNTYGPTEATVVATCAELSMADLTTDGEALPIGLPLPGVRAILSPVRDAAHADAYALSLAGPCLADGYLGRDALTLQRFRGRAGQERSYQTGDLVRRAPNGQLVFLGRRDDQLKISGHRVELREVESALLCHPHVREAVVVVTGPGVRRQLTAHLVAETPALDVRALRAHARRLLIAAAVPAAFRLHDQLPRSVTGKIDRRRLSEEPVAAEPAATDDGDLSELEATVLDVWREVLGTSVIGVDQDFFELGGQSLQTIQLANRLGQRLARDVHGALLFQNPTVRALAQALEQPEGSHTALDVRAAVFEDASLRDSSLVFRAPPRDSGPAAVLLTGATGFLGVQLLRELVLRTEGPIVCLVRAENAERARERLRESLRSQQLDESLLVDRVRALPADLSKPKLGLSEGEFARLGAECEVILHNAASVSLTRAYSSVRAINVAGTRELLRLASHAARPSFHYVSTLAIALGAAPGQALPERFVDYHEGLQDGYSQSKWASERLLAQALERGLSLKIYRLGRLVGALDTYAVNREDLVWRLLAAGVRAGALPELGVREPWTPVDCVARAVVAGVLDRELRGPIFNLAPGELLSLGDVMRWTRAFGYPVAIVGAPEFRSALSGAGAKIDPATLALLDTQAQRALPDIEAIDTTHARELLQRARLEWPALGASDIRRYLATCVAQGLMPPPSEVRGRDGYSE